MGILVTYASGLSPAEPEPGRRFGSLRQTLRAEWEKLCSVPSTSWLLLGAVVVTVALSALTSTALSRNSSAACHPGAAKLTLTGLTSARLWWGCWR